MRTIEELEDLAERFDFESDSPFLYPDENLLESQALPCSQLEMPLEPWGGSCAAVCPGKRGGEPQTAEEKFFFSPASNTGLVKYQNGEPQTFGGYDGGVEASIDGEWDGELFDCLCAQLDECKQASDDGKIEDSLLEIGFCVWKVRPTGASSGFLKYKYVLESHGVKLYIHSNPKGSIPPVRVRFGFECLARTDLFDAVDTLKKCLKEVGFTWVSETLSRVDMQVLLPVDIYEYLDAMRGNRVVTQCRGKCEMVSDCRTLRVQTITFRSQNMELCIYDKKAQVLDSDSVYYMTFYRWILGGVMPEHLTRVEFRFRRPMLRRYGVTTFDDLMKSQRALPQLVGRDWFRILEREKVRGSENEIKNALIWERTLQAFDYCFAGMRGVVRSVQDLKEYKEPKTIPTLKRVVKQAVGCLASAAALCLPTPQDGESVVKFCSEKIKEFSEVLYFKVIERQIKNETIRGFTVDMCRHLDCRQEIELALVPQHIRDYLGNW